MSNNNLSRSIFSAFISKYESVMQRVDSRNVFEVMGMKYAFSITSKNQIECRQFYEDCDGVLCFNTHTQHMYEIKRNNLDIDTTPNRITSKGIKAFSATAPLYKATKTGFKL